MMPLTLFGSRSFVGITLLTLMLYGELASLLVLVLYVLIQEAGYSGLAAGAALLPFPLVIAAASPLIGALTGRIGAKIPLIAGSLVVAAGFLLATDNLSARHPCHSSRHGGRRRALDDSSTDHCRIGVRLQQRCGAHRRPSGDRASRQRARRIWSGIDRRFPYRRCRVYRRLIGGRVKRLRPDRKLSRSSVD
jgi:hypothetical protein